MAASVLLLGLHLHFRERLQELTENVAIHMALPGIFLAIYMVAFGMGPATIPWTLLGELVPAKVFNNLTNFLMIATIQLSKLIFILGGSVGQQYRRDDFYSNPLLPNPSLSLLRGRTDLGRNVLDLCGSFFDHGPRLSLFLARDERKISAGNFGQFCSSTEKCHALGKHSNHSGGLQK